MRVFGKQVSNWWFIAVAPLLIVVSPALLMLFFMGNNLAGAIVGPPAIWNRTWGSPPRSELLGTYQESERHLDQSSGAPPATIALNGDGTMVVSNLSSPSEQIACTLSTQGFWGGPYDGKIDIRFPSEKNAGCDMTSYSELELAGHKKPYSLYMIVGDPDSGTSVWFRQR